ncbi:hypothetical protein [Oceanobacter kriegii]|uniref:hypothetical protein n=1 Tax=Oceanobacter kriegii TaxID=64972 RepID=UPI0012EC3EE6|nr:hypothetical protein [Oceanobacter kriegii]
MTQLAKSVQFPVPCPDCDANTAFSLAKLSEQPNVTCRHCNKAFEISDFMKRRVSRTLRDIEGYIDTPATQEDPQEDESSSELEAEARA